jgi:ElaB/YqjD/DUF883 family membrane-anchored ribosome-binding protein
MTDTNKAMPYDQAIKDLLNKVAHLQTDLSEIAGEIGAIAAHGMKDLREETTERANAIAMESQRLAELARRNAASFEKSLENTLRRQPLLTVGVAAAIGFLFLLARRK